MKDEIRDEMQKLMGRDARDSPIKEETVANKDSVKAFNAKRSNHSGPTIGRDNLITIDFYGTKDSKWNKRVAEICARKFVSSEVFETYGYSEDVIREKITSHLKTLISIYKAQINPGAAPIFDEDTNVEPAGNVRQRTTYVRIMHLTITYIILSFEYLYS